MRRCPICGKKINGKIRYCNFCISIKNSIDKILRKEKYHKNTKCICCGKTLKNRQRIYCTECGITAKKIKWRVYMNNHMKKVRGTDTMKDKFDEIETSIEVSDKGFSGGLCNEDCFNCIYEDCILPDDVEDFSVDVVDTKKNNTKYKHFIDKCPHCGSIDSILETNQYKCNYCGGYFV